MLQCVVVRCSVLQNVVVRCSVLPCVAVIDGVMQSNAVYCIVFKLQCFALFSALQRVGSVLHCVGVYWSVLGCCSVLPCIAMCRCI